MADTLIKVDLSKPATSNENVHNRWHPDIPMACWVKPGDEFILETYDWTGGFIKNNDSADDVRDIDLSTVHYLSGPVGSRAQNQAICLSSICLTSAPSKIACGVSTVSSAKRMAAASSRTTSPKRRNPSGISMACSPVRAMCQACSMRA